MPCDNNCHDEVFSDILDEVEQIIHRVNPSNIVFGGDLNTDFSRNSPHTVELKQFIEKLNLFIGIDGENANVPYTFIGNKSNSRIDNF